MNYSSVLPSLCSVVMATYDGDDLNNLVMAVDSILCQSYKNIELIIVVDGAVEEIKRSYLSTMSEYKNVKIIYLPENYGPAHARNVGIDESKGDYIAIMDADDLSDPNRINLQFKYLHQNRLDFVSSWMFVVDGSGSIIGERRIPLSKLWIKLLSPIRCPMHNPSLFCRAESIRSLKYDESFRLSEDYDLWIRAMLSGYELGNLPKPLVKYRQDNSSISKRIGFVYFKSDIRAKIKSIRLFPFLLMPLVAAVIVATSLCRLLPLSIFKKLYKLRNVTLN